MDQTTKPSFSSRSNAKRAAEKMLTDGTAPGIDYGIKPLDDGRFEIVWKTANGTSAAPTTEEVEGELAEAAQSAGPTQTVHSDGSVTDTGTIAEAAQAAPPAATDPARAEPAPQAAAEADAAQEPAPAAPAPIGAEPEADPFPAGSQVQLRARMVGYVTERIDDGHWAIKVIVDAAQVIRPVERQARTPRTASGPRRSKAAADAEAARGVMPKKPDVTSHANHHYQKRFDKLAELAAAGDWTGVADYECNGVNSYAKMVRQYRDRLVAAHKAQEVSQ